MSRLLTQTPRRFILTLTNGRGGTRTLMHEATYSEYVNVYQFHHPTECVGSSDKASPSLLRQSASSLPILKIACYMPTKLRRHTNHLLVFSSCHLLLYMRLSTQLLNPRSFVSLHLTTLVLGLKKMRVTNQMQA